VGQEEEQEGPCLSSHPGCRTRVVCMQHWVRRKLGFLGVCGHESHARTSAWHAGMQGGHLSVNLREGPSTGWSHERSRGARQQAAILSPDAPTWLHGDSPGGVALAYRCLNRGAREKSLGLLLGRWIGWWCLLVAVFDKKKQLSIV